LERLILGDDHEARRTGIPESAVELHQQGEHRGVDETAVGEVDQKRGGALRQGALNLDLELSCGGQVQFSAHLKRCDTTDRMLLDFWGSRLRAEAIVHGVDMQDPSRF
jgi:hypothetical protein